MANDAALQATAAQLRDSRYQADTWLNVTLPPMMKLWKGIGNIRASNFFISEEDARQAKGAYVDSRPFRFAESLWRMGQVQKDPKHDYRGKIAEFVVDFPTDPVTPTVNPRHRSTNRFISVVYGTPRFNASRTTAFACLSTAGFSTSKSAARKSSSTCPPNLNVTGSPSSSAIDSFNSSADAASFTVTIAPCSTNHLDTPTPPPNRPRPITSTFFPFTDSTTRSLFITALHFSPMPFQK